MDNFDDGGPVFPIHEHDYPEKKQGGFDGVTVWSMGMSRRDYFAAAALAGGLEQGVENDLASVLPHSHSWWHDPKKIADRAYAIADAMLERSGY